jgi:hypothetical protein
MNAAAWIETQQTSLRNWSGTEFTKGNNISTVEETR